MLTKAIRLTILGLIVGIALYIVTFNGAPTTVYFGGSNSFQASTGVILIVTFALGIITATLVAALFAIKSYFRERKLIVRDRKVFQFLDQLQEAREVSAIGDLAQGKNAWQSLIQHDPTSTIARIELAKLLLAEGNSREALSALDEARVHAPDNMELLNLAADVNLALNNRTAALDNLSLLLKQKPNPTLVQKARNIAEELERPQEALKIHEMLYSLGERGQDYRRILSRLEFKILMEEISDSDYESQKSQLEKFVRKHKDSPEALARLAEIEKLKGEVKQAAQHLADAARAGGEAKYWYEAATLWLKHNLPESAIAAARTATREASGKERILAELDLIRLYIALSRLEEARDELQKLPELISSEQVIADKELLQSIYILQALCLNRLGEHKEVSKLLSNLSKSELIISKSDAYLQSQNEKNGAPSPILSTP